MGMRAVLEFLLRNGDTTVPDMARSRGVSRQQIQSLVNPLLEQGLVRTVANPAHRRSALIQLTGRGSQTIRRMRRREAQAFFRGDTDLDAAELERTAASLRAIRRSLARPGS